jgi:hypothetical protein
MDEKEENELHERAYKTITELMQIPWYARPDDVIGGWCVMPVDELPSQGMFQVASFVSQEIAEHVALLHNIWLSERTVRKL